MRAYTAEENAANVALILALIAEQPGGCDMSRLRANVSFSRPILNRYLRSLVGCGKIRSEMVTRPHHSFASIHCRRYFLCESEVPS